MVVDGLGFAEGPMTCPDGTLVVTSVDRGVVYRVAPEAQRATVLARTGGGPNAATPAAGGAVAVTQNGGFDFSAMPEFPDPPPVRRTTPGIQLVGLDGSVTYAASEGFQSPNDLAAGRDGTLFFTDPPRYPPTPGATGRVWRIGPDGIPVEVAGGFRFCNGIAVDADGSLVVVDWRGLVRIGPGGPGGPGGEGEAGRDAERETIVADLGEGGADGLCIDADGRLYVAATTAHGVRVVEDGREVDFLALAGPGMTTNCCFGGPDGTTLFATDGLPGRLVAWEGMPAPGLPVWPWQSPPGAVPSTGSAT